MQNTKFSVDFFTGPTIAPLAALLHAQCFNQAWNEAAFVSALGIPGTVFELLNISGEPAAFALYRQIKEESEILTLGTLPECRGKGFASALLDQGIAFLKEKGVGVLFLEVGSQNISAQRLYRAKGFTDYGRRESYYNHSGGREDAVMMKITL